MRDQVELSRISIDRSELLPTSFSPVVLSLRVRSEVFVEVFIAFILQIGIYLVCVLCDRVCFGVLRAPVDYVLDVGVSVVLVDSSPIVSTALGGLGLDFS